MEYEYSIPNNATIDTTIRIFCKKHGWFFQTLRVHIYKKCGCPVCANEIRNQKKKKTIDYFLNKANKVHNNFYYYPDWINKDSFIDNYDEKIKILCPNHGEFFQTIRNHLQGSGCPFCGKQQQAKKKRKPVSYFIEKAHQVHNNKYDYSLVTQHTNSSKDLITIVCPIHGEFKQTWATHIDKQAGCPECSLEKRRNTTYAKYGVSHKSQIHYSEKTLQLLNNKQWLQQQHLQNKRTLEDIANELNIQDTTIGKYFKKHGIDVIRFSVSAAEKQLSEFLNESNIEHITNTRNIIPPYELDIYIPEYNLAIEYCGLYWHSEQAGKDKNYHRNKYVLCKQNNIRLLTIFEDEWKNKHEIVKNKILYILNKSQQKIFARSCFINTVSRQQKSEFFEKYHIQGDGPSSINYGLFYDNNLIAVMGFIQRQNNSFILNRYATSCSVIGGFSKLLKYFQQRHDWKQIVTFADLRWSEGKLYLKNGFLVDKILQPDYFYIENNQRFHKFNYRRKFLPIKLENFNPLLSEKQNCDNNGLLRIWDCGKIRFVLNNC